MARKPADKNDPHVGKVTFLGGEEREIYQQPDGSPYFFNDEGQPCIVDWLRLADDLLFADEPVVLEVGPQ